MSRAIRIAVLGLYRSGSTAVAGALHHLGVDMGAPFFFDYYEPEGLSQQLRIWWNEPSITEATPAEERIKLLAQWVQEREKASLGWIGAKHPLLCLCGPDLLKAWGSETRWVWTHRPLEKSILSLIATGWWPNQEEFIQDRLWRAVTQFLVFHPHLRIDFSSMMADPVREIHRIVEYVGIQPSEEQLAAALQSIRPTSRD